MLVSQKSQYALRAIFELAKRVGKGPVSAVEISKNQAIPLRFLEAILAQLKQGGFVESRRGNEGGYVLKQAPERISVRDIIEFVQGPIGPIDCLTGAEKGEASCPLHGGCVFMPMWEEVRDAIAAVYERTTLDTLVEREKQSGQTFSPCYSI